MKSYSIKILVFTFLVELCLLGLNHQFSIIHKNTITFITLLFASNSWLALIPFYIFKNRNPRIVFVVGSLIHNLIVGILICFYYYHTVQNAKGFFIISILVFVIFQIIEIFQLTTDREIFKKVK